MEEVQYALKTSGLGEPAVHELVAGYDRIGFGILDRAVDSHCYKTAVGRLPVAQAFDRKPRGSHSLDALARQPSSICIHYRPPFLKLQLRVAYSKALLA